MSAKIKKKNISSNKKTKDKFHCKISQKLSKLEAIKVSIKLKFILN